MSGALTTMSPEDRRLLDVFAKRVRLLAPSAADLNLANGLHRSAVNRAYYAMFYSVLDPAS